MPPTALTRVLLGSTLVLALVGAVQSVRDSAEELVVLFVAIAMITALQWLRLLVGRPPVPLRADLVRWITQRGQLTGEHPGRIADRAVAAFRASLGEGPVEESRGGPSRSLER